MSGPIATTSVPLGIEDRPASAEPALTRRQRRLVLACWAALVFNGLTFFEFPILVPIPGSLARLMTQGALVASLGIAVALNRRLLVRPNLPLLLLTLLTVVAFMTSLHNEFLAGSVYRASRFLVFVGVLWLLTPLWGRWDKPLLRAHIVCIAAVVASVVLGALLSPGAAFSFGGRLSGALWPIPPTQVAHYAAVLLGLVVIQWLVGETRARWALLAAAACGGVLVGTHTRTALIALLLGLLVAVASLFLGYARVRRASSAALVTVVVVVAAFAPLLGSWLLRDQSAGEVTNLTGRTLVWEQVIALRRGLAGRLFGSGMSNAEFNGLPIDSSWVASYLDLGLFGITLQVIAISALFITAIVRPRGHARAAALFLLVYLVVASFTETALNSPSLYVLELVVAASLLARAPGSG